MNANKKKIEPRLTGDIELITIPSSKRLGKKTRKNSSRLTGDIEMIAIPSSKKLVNKSLKNKVSSPIPPSSKTKLSVKNENPKLSIKMESPKSSVKNENPKLSIKMESPKLSSKPVESEKTKKRAIYKNRVKYSKCRGLAKTVCLNKKRCMFTNGDLRKYCRKKYNKRIQL